MTDQQLSCSVLYQNHSRTITLIDIPNSIARAQSAHNALRSTYLVSAVPQDAPFPSNEPKTDAAKAKIQRNTVDASLHAVYASLLNNALSELRQHVDGTWCLPRPFVEEKPQRGKKRKTTEDSTVLLTGTLEDEKVMGLPGDLLSDLQDLSTKPSTRYEKCIHTSARSTMNTEVRSMDDTAEGTNAPTWTDWDSVFHNAASHAVQLEIRKKSIELSSPSWNFHVPCHSSFFLSNCSATSHFHKSVRNLAQDHGVPRHFDFILLDPPWPNASVRRTHRTPLSTYQVSESLYDIRELVLGMDLDMLMKPGTLVGIWITNKSAVRELVLGTRGLFETWGVELAEEWLWLKVTVHGEPVASIESLWRKPYEVLLLGRRRSTVYNPDVSNAEENQEGVIKRRVIVGVPDLHSRKPCLKELIEPLMSDPEDYTALEVFARYLVAGWWSWGNEVIKFNWEGCWKDLSREQIQILEL
ncbi:hypothetical protein LTR28_008956 [Elasticomyces elasticus]|nr:hypothetical protein LTR28_008956 [Elasticomyces elasticus]